MNNIINVKNLKDKNNILKEVSFNVKKGEIVGILGINGAGKTTLLKMLCGLIKQEEGEVLILGKNTWYEIDEILKNIGIMIELPIFYEHLTAFENIKIHLEYMNCNKDVNSILKSVGLINVNRKPVSKFSLGMRQKLAIARAISHSPKILILDEPINTLDPIVIRNMRKLFLRLKEEGMTIILSSHILNEVFETVERIMILSNGKIHNLGIVSMLQERYKDKLEDYIIERMGGENV